MTLAFAGATVAIVPNRCASERLATVEADSSLRIDVKLIALLMVRIERHF